MTSTPRSRVLVIALSEATLDLIRPWAKSGVLPTLQRFLSEGTVGTLRSQIPTITPQMWGTIVTGRGPGHHGVFDFSQRGPDGKFRETNGSDIKGKPIWQLLTENGVPSGIVNVPFTYPPQPMSGFMISGQDAPGAHRSIAYPPEVYDEIVSKFGAYHVKVLGVVSYRRRRARGPGFHPRAGRGLQLGGPSEDQKDFATASMISSGSGCSCYFSPRNNTGV